MKKLALIITVSAILTIAVVVSTRNSVQAVNWNSKAPSKNLVAVNWNS